MNIGTALRGAHFLVTTGSDLLRDDLAPHVTTAVEQTASEHADALGDEFPTATDASLPEDVPAFVEDEALPPEESGEFVLTTLLYKALETPELERELDGLTDKGETVGREILAAELEARATEDLALDFEAVAADFCRYLGRALSSDGDLSRKYLITLVQEIHEKVDDGADATPTPREVLYSQGFEILDDDYIENRDTDPEFCWRRSFTFAEIRAGYPIERDWPTDEYERVTDVLLADATDGGAVALVSPPGAGKTTTTRMAAIEWYDQHDDGVVVYHQGRTPITDAEALTDALQSVADDQSVLVVVEDAARRGVEAFYRTLYEVEATESVSVLLNSREREWDGFDDRLSAHDDTDRETQEGREITEIRTRYVTRRTLPEVGTTEIERVLTRFEDLTGKTVQADPDALATQIHAKHGASPMLLLSYHLPIGDVDVRADEDTSALETNVRRVFDQITDPDDGTFPEVSDDDLLASVGLLANVLNAAEIPVAREYLYALGADDDAVFEAIDHIREAFDGVLFFGEDGDGQHWSHHPLWSELYLQRHLDTATSVRSARKQFEDAVNALFRFLGDSERRTAIGTFIGRPTSRLRAHDNYPEALASKAVEVVFEIGENRPWLSPLYSTTDYSAISLPNNCPPNTRANCALSRHKMHRIRGHLETAMDELENFRSLANDELDSKTTAATYYNARGKMSHGQGDYEEAREYVEKTLAIARDLGDHARRSHSLNNLGIIALEQGGFVEAQQYCEKSLTISRDFGDCAGEAKSLTNLGLVALEQEDFEGSQEYYEQSLAIERELRGRAGEAKSLTNFGLLAFKQGDLDGAQTYHEESLSISRDLGDRAGEARSLGNLGLVAHKRENFEEAREYHKESLDIERDLGNRAGEADCLGNLGNASREQKNFEEAAGYFDEAHATFQVLGTGSREMRAISNLIAIHVQAGNKDAALEWCTRGLDRCESLDIDVTEREHEFHCRRAELVETAERTRELCRYALSAILRSEPTEAIRLLQAMWERRAKFDQEEDIYSVIAGAGVGLTACIAVLDTEELADDQADILDEVASTEDRLNRPAKVLYEYLRTGEAPTSSEELVEAVGSEAESKPTLEELEAGAYAMLLEKTQEEA